MLLLVFQATHLTSEPHTNKRRQEQSQASNIENVRSPQWLKYTTSKFDLKINWTDKVAQKQLRINGWKKAVANQKLQKKKKNQKTVEIIPSILKCCKHHNLSKLFIRQFHHLDFQQTGQLVSGVFAQQATCSLVLIRSWVNRYSPVPGCMWHRRSRGEQRLGSVLPVKPSCEPPVLESMDPTWRNCPLCVDFHL